MPFWSRTASSGNPRTNIGRWLHAVLLRQNEQLEPLKLKLNGGKETGWNDDEPAVVEAVCELAVGKLFGTGYDVRAVTAFVTQLREATAGDSPLDALETEAVIRRALGDRDVVTEGITAGQKWIIHLAAMGGAIGRLMLGEAEIDQMITDAEKITFERGWNPPLAD